MNNHRRWLCQTSWCLLVLGLWLPGGLRAADAPAASPAAPPWQGELDADRALQASLLLAPAASPAEDQARREKLAALYRQLAARYPDAFAVQKSVGDGLSQLENLQAALPYWLQAGKLNPKNAEVADSLGSAYLQAGKVREASAQYQRAVDDAPDVASYHSDLANVLYIFRQELLSPPALPDEQAVLRLALSHFRRAAALSPGSLPLARAYAETFYILTPPDWTEALAAWQNVRALSGDDTDFANLHLARVSLRLQRRADAEGYLAAIRSPGFAAAKAKLSAQAARLDASSSLPTALKGDER